MLVQEFFRMGGTQLICAAEWQLEFAIVGATLYSSCRVSIKVQNFTHLSFRT
jgi:hypothetical protein